MRQEEDPDVHFSRYLKVKLKSSAVFINKIGKGIAMFDQKLNLWFGAGS